MRVLLFVCVSVHPAPTAMAATSTATATLHCRCLHHTTLQARLDASLLQLVGDISEACSAQAGPELAAAAEADDDDALSGLATQVVKKKHAHVHVHTCVVTCGRACTQFCTCFITCIYTYTYAHIQLLRSFLHSQKFWTLLLVRRV